MRKLTKLECFLLDLLSRLNDQQRKDIIRLMEAFVQSNK